MIMHGTFTISANAALAAMSLGEFHNVKNGKTTNIAQ